MELSLSLAGPIENLKTYPKLRSPQDHERLNLHPFGVNLGRG